MSGLRGSFNDGQSAERVEVEVSLEAAGLRLTSTSTRSALRPSLKLPRSPLMP